jgi:subtilisin family serine protease
MQGNTWRKGVAGVVVTATALLVAAVVVPASGAVAAQVGSPAQRWVTLVTGDRVLVDHQTAGDRFVRVAPAKGREKVAFLRYQDGGDLVVVPDDAAPLLTSGRLDRRLFDVSKLVEFGYDDASRGDLPLIVSSAPPARARTLLSTPGVWVTHDLSSVGAAAVNTDKTATNTLWRTVSRASGITRIALDGPVRSTLDQSVSQIGAPEAWQAGYTGAGATVAVLDSGVDTTHPDLADAVAAAANFTDSPNGTRDVFGHGTHVASIITGSGAASDGRYRGVAPDARILSGKVLGDDGYARESWIIAGLEWAVAQHANVVNMSLSNPWSSDGTDPMSLAVDRLTAQSGTLFVVAAGNAGPHEESVGSPGAADAALTVGAVTKQDELADFSSRGPRLLDKAIKPDITAPGVDIVAARADGSRLGELVGDLYTRMSGTSMAAPHVAGAAAILAAQHPDLKAGDLKAMLMASAKPKDGLTVYQQGAGRVDVARSTAQGLYTQPASISNGITRWPHQDDQPIATSVTYRNVTDTPLTLDLAADVRDPSGAAAPSGMFTVNPSRLTIPARGSASATLTTNTAVPGPDGVYGGALIATSADGRTVVRTPVGVEREVESYDLALSFLDSQGQPTPYYAVRIVDIEHPRAYLPGADSATVTARLPKGHYYFEASVGNGTATTFAIEPDLTITADASLTIDQRDGRPFGAAVDQPTARSVNTEVGFTRVTAWGITGTLISGGSMEDSLVRPSTTATPAGQFTFAVNKILAEPDGSADLPKSPYLYHIRWTHDGQVPTDLIPRIHDRDLAGVRTEIAETLPNKTLAKDWAVLLTAPATLTEFFTPDVRWSESLVQFAGDSSFSDIETSLIVGSETFARGATLVRRWNAAVFGPAFPPVPAGDDPSTFRSANTISAQPALFTDQESGHQGYSATDSGSLVLYRDGQQVGASNYPDFGRFDVPSDPGTYRLEATATRSVSNLSTRVSSAWTFPSGHTDGQQALPMMAVRFAPAVDAHNRARAGRPFTFPVSVQRQQGATYGTLNNLVVQVSYDDGATWRPARLTGHGLDRTVCVTHPAGPGFVSLKATATDTAGNQVEQTIIRAYAIS